MMNNEEIAALKKKIMQDLGFDKVNRKNYQGIEIAHLVFHIANAVTAAYFDRLTKQEDD